MTNYPSPPQLIAHIIGPQAFVIEATAFRAQLEPAVKVMLDNTRGLGTATTLPDGRVEIAIAGPAVAGIEALASAVLWSTAVRLADLLKLEANDFELRVLGGTR